MADDDAFYCEPVVTRRPRPPQPDLPPPFKCVICEHLTRSEVGRTQRPPICSRCALQASQPLGRWSGTTNGDYRVLMRLRAITNALQWEVYNGRYSPFAR